MLMIGDRNTLFSPNGRPDRSLNQFVEISIEPQLRQSPKRFTYGNALLR